MQLVPTRLDIVDDVVHWIVEDEGETLDLEFLDGVELGGVAYFVLRPWSQADRPDDDEGEDDIYVFSTHTIEGEEGRITFGTVDEATIDAVLDIAFPAEA